MPWELLAQAQALARVQKQLAQAQVLAPVQEAAVLVPRRARAAAGV